jgi:hypothetical protein
MYRLVSICIAFTQNKQQQNALKSYNGTLFNSFFCVDFFGLKSNHAVLNFQAVPHFFLPE